MALEMVLWPMIMRHHPAERDAISFPEPTREAGRPCNCGCLPGWIVKFTDLDSDTHPIAGAVMVSMFALDIDRKRLHNLLIVNGEMPGQITRPVV